MSSSIKWSTSNIRIPYKTNFANGSTQFLFTIGENENWLMKQSIKTLASFGKTAMIEKVKA